MEVQFVCLYCGEKWRKKVYAGETAQVKCSICGDRNVDAVELSKYRIDSYQGCPPFEEKKKDFKIDLETIDFPFWTRGD